MRLTPENIAEIKIRFAKTETVDEFAQLLSWVYALKFPKNSEKTTIIIDPLHYNYSGEYWHNVDLGLFKARLGTAKFMPAAQYFQIFNRQKGFRIRNTFFGSKHTVNVTLMQEVDNAAGSYMGGMGNIVEVADAVYFLFSQLYSGTNRFSHKSTLTALGINKNLWPSDGSHGLNLQDMGLMYTKFNYHVDNDKNNFFGYPNLGRPTDHFSITPFEAIYADDEIKRHIDHKYTQSSYIDSINRFLMNEIEPWYLGLQNQQVGGTARTDYSYYSYRRAKHGIVTGHLVTPITDPGDYEVNANAVMEIRAGDYVHHFPGTHFKPGSNVHVSIGYEACSGTQLAENSTRAKDSAKAEDDETTFQLPEKTETGSVKIFPNPNTGIFRIEAPKEMEKAEISGLNGIRVYTEQIRSSSADIRLDHLPKGIYILHITIAGKTETHKIIIL